MRERVNLYKCKTTNEVFPIALLLQKCVVISGLLSEACDHLFEFLIKIRNFRKL